MAIDHTNCEHPRTPAGRRACRDGRNITPLPSVTRPTSDAATDRRVKAAALQTKLNAMADAPVRLTGAQARKITRHAAKADNRRNQPRRSRKVADDGSGCVQAALHTGRGRCACGWDTM